MGRGAKETRREESEGVEWWWRVKCVGSGDVWRCERREVVEWCDGRGEREVGGCEVRLACLF